MSYKLFRTALVLLFISAVYSGLQAQESKLSARQVIELIQSKVTCPWSAQTVDTFKAGNPEDMVSGIAVCMFADMKVLREAVAAKCNLIITHEPLFYSHLDETKTLTDDPVFQEKMKYILDHQLIIWRFHDHIHKTNPDGIYAGMMDMLGWRNNRTDSSMIRYRFERIKLVDFVQKLKQKFPGSSMRVVGNPDSYVSNVALSVGAPGSSYHLKLLKEKKIDLLIAGESPEWETYQYAYDAQLQGRTKAVIFLGHINSEAAGMDYCARWMKGFIPKSVNIQYIKNESSFKTY
jgi:putative NIF3 family GTP cyclohydrolase 1 type 2